MKRIGLFLLLALAFGVALWLATGGPGCLKAEADGSLSIFIANSGASTANIDGVAYRVHNIPPFVPLLGWTSLPPGQTSTQFVPANANTTYDVRVLYAPPGKPPSYKTQVVAVGTSSVTATFTGP